MPQIGHLPSRDGFYLRKTGQLQGKQGKQGKQGLILVTPDIREHQCDDINR